MKYEKIKYPDGQFSIKLVDMSTPWTITKSILSYEDLVEVLTVGQLCNSLGIIPDLIVNVLFTQRSDRQFTPNQSVDLRTTASLLNLVNWYKVGVFDPHSQSTLDLIKNSYRIDPLPYVNVARKLTHNAEQIVLVSPDAGAYKRIFEYGEKLNLPVVGAVKHRDFKGQVDLKLVGDVAGKDCFVIDDLADGGYTFILLGKALKDLGARNLYLYVSHGYFSKGFEQLSQYYKMIFTTDSVRKIQDPIVKQFTLDDLIIIDQKSQ